MVHAIITLTVTAVSIVAAANLARGAWLGLRLGHHLRKHYAAFRSGPWVPLVRSTDDLVEWLSTWDWVLRSPDPILVTLRSEIRVVAVRHLGLMVTSHVWALAVAVILAHAR